MINIEKSKDKKFLNDKSQEKLKSKIKQLEKLKNNNEGGKNENIKYFLLSDVINSKKYEKLKNIKKGKKHFSIKELKIIESYEEILQNNVIKVKNLFCVLLYNYPNLNKNEFIKEKLNNTTNIVIFI